MLSDRQRSDLNNSIYEYLLQDAGSLFTHSPTHLLIHSFLLLIQGDMPARLRHFKWKEALEALMLQKENKF